MAGPAVSQILIRDGRTSKTVVSVASRATVAAWRDVMTGVALKMAGWKLAIRAWLGG